TLTTTTTYYVAVEGDGYCENAPANRKPVTVTVNPLATAANITVANDTICSGTTSTLTASSNIGHPKFYWYNGPTATAVLVSNANPFTTLTLTTTTTYYVAVSGDGYCENAPANRKPVTVTVNPRATAADIIIADAIVCEGESATLTPTTNISDPTFYWYINQTTTTYFHTGNHYDTPNLYADVTYYIAVAGENYCENTINTRKPVRVTVKRTSTVPTITNDQPKCLGEEITFRVTNASSYSNGVTFTWYKANPTTQVGTGVTYATTVPGEYFVIASDAGCFSPASTPMEAFFGEAASITWEVEPVINVSGTTAVITGTITNTGIADMLPPIHVTFYKNNIAPSAIMGMDVIDYALEIGESYPLTFTITNWSDFTPIAGIWVSINDNMGVYPEQMECSADGRRYIERKCPDTIEYYGIKYSVTPLGGYCWTSNLQTTLYDDGSQIAFANPYNHPQYPNVEENQAIFGLLYTWFSAVGVPEGYTDGLSGVIQGICPYGWHVPSQAELDVLSLFPASDLKSKDYWLVPGNDTYGFDARPAGRYNSITGRYEDLYGYTGWWASNTNPGVFANYVSMSYFCNSPENKLIKRADGLSVRCIMD
ncbi:MAG: hypothetical protein FWF65_00005, partial [Bacteroidetes bacterium]|nr:hypothetical protein [Bacteroidota bacterium]